MSASDDKTINTEQTEVDPGMDLSSSEKSQLLKMARHALEKKLGIVQNDIDAADFPSPQFDLKRGLFVTLRKGDRLRGCIGHIHPMGKLRDEVAKIAVLAAYEDPRFPPVSEGEYNDLHFEITILSPMRKIKDPVEVIPGKHGLLIRKGYFQGLLLPQVAIDYGWNREEFLTQTCRKAGLPSDAWKDKDTDISVFTAEYFE